MNVHATDYHGGLLRFVTESNAIEGITRQPTRGETEAHEAFLLVEKPTAHDLICFVEAIEPDTRPRLRVYPGMNVMVGNYHPPVGGPHIADQLDQILKLAIEKGDAWRRHIEYESLHPFTDGNGRSGRALWLWVMTRRGGLRSLSFLHQFYYQTLERIGRWPAGM